MTAKIKPDWAGDDFLSKIINVLINTKPIYQIMKFQARNVLIKTAEKKGVSWRKNYQELEKSAAKSLFNEIKNPNLTYPDYYQVPFHAYPEGNLSWKAAFEAPSATYAMCLRVWPQEEISPETAHERLRGSFLKVLSDYSPQIVHNALDIGCSVGISTLALHRYLSQRQNEPVNTVGLDLSPYMLSVARVLDQKGEISQWIHGLAEKTEFADNFFDVITLQFVLHELPQKATKAIFTEALRILKPNGCLAIVDNNPKSPVIQNLPPVLFTLMKSTEPWSDEYYTFDVEKTLEQVGFEYQTTVATDPRHRTIIAIKR
jgi:ubiquinone/menaquinone biosynthesis C-methylase UbiE